MRTNIDIDDELMASAMQASGLPTKKATIEQALRSLVQAERQVKALDALWGIGWEGDLEEMRKGWRPEDDDTRG